MNQSDLDREKLYRIQERIGLSCGASKPIKAEQDRAEMEVAVEMAQIETIAALDEVLADWKK